MPTCIEARVRRLELKKTRATDLPSSDLVVASDPLLSASAESIIRSRSARERPVVDRKCMSGRGCSEPPNRVSRYLQPLPNFQQKDRPRLRTSIEAAAVAARSHRWR